MQAEACRAIREIRRPGLGSPAERLPTLDMRGQATRIIGRFDQDQRDLTELVVQWLAEHAVVQ